MIWSITKSAAALLHFSQTCEFWSSKANWRLLFSLPSIILTDLLGNKTLIGSKGHGFWFVIGEFRSVLCVCVSRFVTCDRNHDWRQPKTQLRGRLLNLRVRMFVKSAVKLQYNYQVSNVKITDRFLDIWTSSLNSLFIWFLTEITSSRLMNSSKISF